jgi:beta-galactosidase GanA
MNEITRRQFVKGSALASLSIASTVKTLGAGGEIDEKRITDQDIRDTTQPPTFIFAAQFLREPSYPNSELKHDMQAIKDLGLNTIRFQNSWSYLEAKEGHFDFSKILDLVEEADRNRLFVYFSPDLVVPGWAWEKHRNAIRITANGTPLFGFSPYGYSDGKPGPCWNHPGMRAAGERFLQEFVHQFSQYNHVVAWLAYQELSPMECFCDLCIKKFRLWLSGRYGTLKVLNESWLTRYALWEHIEPPRQVFVNQCFGPIQADWIRFVRANTLDHLEWKASIIRRNDPLRRPIKTSTSGPSYWDEWVHDIAVKGDIHGVPYFPAQFHTAPIPGNISGHNSPSSEEYLPHEMWDTCLQFDSIRVAARNRSWVAGLQCGPSGEYSLYHGADPDPADIHRWMLLALSCGVKGIGFWNYRPEYFGGTEGYKWGIFGRNMTITPRAEEIRRISHAISKHMDLFISGRVPDVRVAILANADTAIFLATYGLQQAFSRSVQGLYRTLWNMGIPVDFLSSRAVHERKLQAYTVAILPFPIAMSDSFADDLKSYVAGGGVLVSEACPGRFSDRDMANYRTALAPGFEELFGVSDNDIRMCTEQDGTKYNDRSSWYKSHISPTWLKGVGPFLGLQVPASFYLETFRLTGAEPLFTYNEETAGTVNSFGHGKAYLIGTYPGLAAMHCLDNTGLKEAFARIFSERNVCGKRTGALIRRDLCSEDKKAMFLINPTKDPVSEIIDCQSYQNVEDLLEGRFDVTSPVTVPPFSVTCLILHEKS